MRILRTSIPSGMKCRNVDPFTVDRRMLRDLADVHVTNDQAGYKEAEAPTASNSANTSTPSATQPKAATRPPNRVGIGNKVEDDNQGVLMLLLGDIAQKSISNRFDLHYFHILENGR